MNEAAGKAFVALAIAVVGGLCGFMLQRFITRDQVAIESVEMTPELKGYEIPSRTWIRVNTPPLSCGNPTWGFMTLQGSYPGDTPTQMGQSELEIYKRLLETQIARYESISVGIGGLQKSLNGTPAYPQSSWAKATSLGVCFSSPVDDAWRESHTRDLETFKESVDSFVVVLKEESKRASEFVFERTGRVTVLVTLINRGDTDGLIARNAKLNWGNDQQLALTLHTAGDHYSATYPMPAIRSFCPEKEGGSTAPATVPRRAATQLVFSIDEANSSIGTLGEFLQAVKAKQSIIYSVEITDFRKETYSSSRMSLSVI